MLQVECGESHTVALTFLGEVYTWFGRCVFAFLCTSVFVRIWDLFVHVERNSSRSRRGSGDDGRLGTGMYSTAFFPRQVKFPTDNFIVRIACGDAFSVAISGELW